MYKFILSIFLILITSTITIAETCIDCHAAPIVEINMNEEIIKLAKSYSYVREKTNNNDATEITQWLKACGVGPGKSYCQAFPASMWKKYYKDNNLGKSPWPMYAGVARVAEYATKHPFDFEVLSTKKILWTSELPEQGDLASWKHGKSNFTGFGYLGHAGFVDRIDIKKHLIYTIEGNTKAPGMKGDQSGTVKGQDPKLFGHDGVYERVRTIDINSNFPIMYFIRLKNKD
jgi:hypothetical protein